jgi:hypothetical protein
VLCKPQIARFGCAGTSWIEVLRRDERGDRGTRTSTRGRHSFGWKVRSSRCRAPGLPTLWAGVCNCLFSNFSLIGRLPAESAG